MNDTSPLKGLPLVLGGNVFGWTASGDDGFAVLDAYYEAGGRTIDTADSYSIFVPGHVGGESESYIGNWLSSRGIRPHMKIHTKVGNLPEHNRYDLRTVTKAIDRSLDRLQTDYVDLYYLHSDNQDISMEQIVESMDSTVKANKARALAASNIKMSRLSESIEIAKATKSSQFIALQNQYNLLERSDFDKNYQTFCLDNKICMFPFFGLASGYLTGKYRNPEDFNKWPRGMRTRSYEENGPALLAVMDQISLETGASLAEIALSWLLRQPGITAPIASARTVDQVNQIVASTSLDLNQDQLDRLTNHD
ncbi:MAG: aldo/keto reductase [Parasphingorhabdus sp.]